MALVNQTETRNWSAVSAVNVVGNQGDVVMYMNASYNGRDLNFSKNIQNSELYKAHKKDVDKDYSDFEEMVENEVYGV